MTITVKGNKPSNLNNKIGILSFKNYQYDHYGLRLSNLTAAKNCFLTKEASDKLLAVTQFRQWKGLAYGYKQFQRNQCWLLVEVRACIYIPNHPPIPPPERCVQTDHVVNLRRCAKAKVGVKRSKFAEDSVNWGKDTSAWVAELTCFMLQCFIPLIMDGSKMAGWRY